MARQNGDLTLSEMIEKAKDEIANGKYNSKLKREISRMDQKAKKEKVINVGNRVYSKKKNTSGLLYSVEYKSKRKLAYKEDRLDFYGEEDVPTTAREQFFQLLQRAYDLGEFVPQKDAEIIKNTFYTHEEFVSKEKIKFLVNCAYQHGGLKKAEETVAEFISLLRKTKYSDPLIQFNKEIRKRNLVSKVKQLKSNGLSNAQISERLNITSAEVTVFSSNSTDLPELFEDEQR